MNPLAALDGYKTIITGIGLICYGAYLASTGEYPQAIQNVFLGFGMIFGRQAIAGVQSELVATRLDVASHTVVVQQALDAARAGKP